jgi:hypothetical protein
LDTNVVKQLKLLRHKSYEMTPRYAHLHPNRLKGVTEVLVNADPQMTRSGRKAEETGLVGFQTADFVEKVAHPDRFERPTLRFEAWMSGFLSFRIF